jgi:hypothetical protein
MPLPQGLKTVVPDGVLDLFEGLRSRVGLRRFLSWADARRWSRWLAFADSSLGNSSAPW